MYIFIAFSWSSQISNKFALYLSLRYHFLVLWYSQRYIWVRMENELLGSEQWALIQRDFIICSTTIWQSCKHEVFMRLRSILCMTCIAKGHFRLEVTSYQACPCSELVNFFFSKHYHEKNKGRLAWGFEQPGLVKLVLAYCRGARMRWSSMSFSKQSSLWFWIWIPYSAFEILGSRRWLFHLIMSHKPFL